MTITTGKNSIISNCFRYDDFMASPPQANESSLQSRVIAFDIDKADSYLLGKSSVTTQIMISRLHIYIIIPKCACVFVHVLFENGLW